MIKVGCYIDGFNIYHAIDEASRAARGALNHLKWVDLRALMGEFTDPKTHEIVCVKLFTAYPTWHADREARHRQFVAAQEHSGVEVIFGQFKHKDGYCKVCRNTFPMREEKESDVNIAMHLVSDAHEDVFDQAFLVTNDSDLLGPVRLVREKFPKKRLKIISPPFRRHSKELWGAATHRAKIDQIHLERCLLPQTANAADGSPAFLRPREYDPPK